MPDAWAGGQRTESVTAPKSVFRRHKDEYFYLLTRQVGEHQRAIVESSARAVKEPRPSRGDTGEMAWSADVSALGKRSRFNSTAENTSETGSQMDQTYREVSVISTKANSVILQLHFYITGNALASLLWEFWEVLKLERPLKARVKSYSYQSKATHLCVVLTYES